MKTYTETAFHHKVHNLWQDHTIHDNIMDQVRYFTHGLIVDYHHFNIPGSHDLFTGIIKDPEFKITSAQLTNIFDAGNHCISAGSIIYEAEYAYITWSNHGHI